MAWFQTSLIKPDCVEDVSVATVTALIKLAWASRGMGTIFTPYNELWFWSFEGHDRLKLDILHLTCQKFLHLQKQWQWTWIQSLSSQIRHQRSPTDAPHMWCELMRFASSKCMCHGTQYPLFIFQWLCTFMWAPSSPHKVVESPPGQSSHFLNSL